MVIEFELDHHVKVNNNNGKKYYDDIDDGIVEFIEMMSHSTFISNNGKFLLLDFQGYLNPNLMIFGKQVKVIIPSDLQVTYSNAWLNESVANHICSKLCQSINNEPMDKFLLRKKKKIKMRKEMKKIRSRRFRM